MFGLSFMKSPAHLGHPVFFAPGGPNGLYQLPDAAFAGRIIFLGNGFGMFVKLQRYEIYYVVAATWILQIICSHIWLRYFRFGSF